MTAFEKLTIDTPEQIALEFTLAGAGSRFIAITIDTLIQFALFATAGLIALAASISWAALTIWAQAAALLILFVLMYGYFALFEWLWNGQTPGKRFAGLRVIGAAGLPITPAQAFIRNLLRVVDQLPAVYGIGIAAVLFTERSQRLGDLAAGTVVVREDRTRREQFTDAPGQPRGARLAASSRLTEAELVLVERFLQRRADLESDVRDETARRIAARLRPRLGAAAAEGSDEDLLERLVSEYRSADR